MAEWSELIAETARPATGVLPPPKGYLQRLREIKLSLLSRRDIATLVQAVAPHADAELIAAHSGGTPLYAPELARSATASRSG